MSKRSNWLGSTVDRIDFARAIETYVQSNTDVSKAVVTNAVGQLSSSAVTLSELALLSGIESNVQDQLTNTRQDVFGSATGATISLGDASYSTVASALQAVYSATDAIDDTVDDEISDGSIRPVRNSVISAALNTKQDNLTFDNEPVINSTNSLRSGVVYTSLTQKAETSALDALITTMFGSSTAAALADVSTTGSYADLSGTPALADVALSGAYSNLSGTPALADVALSGAYSSLSGTPALADVALSGAYSSLSGTPDLSPYQTLSTLATADVSVNSLTVSDSITVQDSTNADIFTFDDNGLLISGYTRGLAVGGKELSAGNIRTTGAGDFDGGITSQYGAISCFENDLTCGPVNIHSSADTLAFRISNQSGTAGQYLAFPSSGETLVWTSPPTLDAEPQMSSTNAVTSDGVHTALALKQDVIDGSNLLDYALLSNTPDLALKQDVIDGSNLLDYSLLSNTPSLGDAASRAVFAGVDDDVFDPSTVDDLFLAYNAPASGELIEGTTVLNSLTTLIETMYGSGSSAQALSAVAISGSYSHLSGTPTIPTVVDTISNGESAAVSSNAVHDALALLGAGVPTVVDVVESGNANAVSSNAVHAAIDVVAGQMTMKVLQNQAALDANPMPSWMSDGDDSSSALTSTVGEIVVLDLMLENDRRPVSANGLHNEIARITNGNMEFATVATTGSFSNLTDVPTLFDGAYGSLTGTPALFDGAYSSLTGTPTLFDGAYSSLTGAPALFDGAYSSLTGTPTLFDGAYSSLTGTPTLFDGAYSSLTGAPALFDGAYSSLTGTPALFDGAYSSLTGTPTLFSGSYDDLTDTPTLFSGSYDDLTDTPTLFSGSYDDLTDTPTLFSGSYDDLTDTPTLFSGSYDDLTDTPTLFSGSYDDLTDTPTLFSGSYDDLTDTPTLFSGSYDDLTDTPTLFSGSYDDLTDTPTLFSGSYDDLTDTPTLFSGSYDDLTDTPTIPTAMTVDTTLTEDGTNAISSSGVYNALANYVLYEDFPQWFQDGETPITEVESSVQSGQTNPVSGNAVYTWTEEGRLFPGATLMGRKITIRSWPPTEWVNAPNDTIVDGQRGVYDLGTAAVPYTHRFHVSGKINDATPNNLNLLNINVGQRTLYFQGRVLNAAQFTNTLPEGSHAQPTNVTNYGQFVGKPRFAQDFAINKSGLYTINVRLQAHNMDANNRSMFLAKLVTSGLDPADAGANVDTYNDEYFLGSSYCRDDTDAYDEMIICGSVTVFLADWQSFNVRVDRVYNESSGTIRIRQESSYLTIHYNNMQIA